MLKKSWYIHKGKEKKKTLGSKKLLVQLEVTEKTENKFPQVKDKTQCGDKYNPDSEHESKRQTISNDCLRHLLLRMSFILSFFFTCLWSEGVTGNHDNWFQKIQFNKSD